MPMSERAEASTNRKPCADEAVEASIKRNERNAELEAENERLWAMLHDPEVLCLGCLRRARQALEGEKR